MSENKWRRVRAGLYRSQGGPCKVAFEIERIDAADSDTDKPSWICRREGVAFDSASTLAEAKSYCKEPEGKPLIEIL